MTDSSSPLEPGANTIDSREVIYRIEWLLEIKESDDGLTQDEADELKILEKVAKFGADYSDDWSYGATLIHDDHFKSYAKELADDCGMIPGGTSWPLTCIDWDKAARELRMDYSPIDWCDNTYWIR